MGLSYLSAVNIRNVKDASLNPHESLNIIYGKNGSGKTSLLEAIYFLGRGKSPRTRFLNRVINNQANKMNVFGRLGFTDRKQIGVQFGRKGGIKLKIDGEKAKTSSELAYALPLLYISSDATPQMYSGSNYRRRFIDWGVFHVEHRFLIEVQRFKRVLKQRNAVLKDRSPGSTLAWDQEFVKSAKYIASARDHFVEQLNPLFQKYSRMLIHSDEFNEVSIVYQRGWQNGMDLESVLEKALSRDQEIGYTRYGPHRADMKLKVEGRSVEEFASAGQLKLLVCALFLAQLELFNSKSDLDCIILIDDLAAELDSIHRNQFLVLLSNLNSQIFVTANDLGIFDLKKLSSNTLFHVEQGVVNESVST